MRLMLCRWWIYEQATGCRIYSLMNVGDVQGGHQTGIMQKQSNSSYCATFQKWSPLSAVDRLMMALQWHCILGTRTMAVNPWWFRFTVAYRFTVTPSLEEKGKWRHPGKIRWAGKKKSICLVEISHDPQTVKHYDSFQVQLSNQSLGCISKQIKRTDK